MKKTFTCIVSIVLAVSFCMVAASASTMHIEASDYLSYYDADVSTSGNGALEIEYYVYSYTNMSQIGVSKIVVQKKVGTSWSSVKYYYSASTAGLLTTNDSSYTNSITYQGTAGKTYRAVVTFYAGDSTGHDTRDFITNSVTA